jgi:hypothetical protein
MSVAPEIARLAEAVLLVQAQPAAPAAPRPGHEEQTEEQTEELTEEQTTERAAAPMTLGTLARRLQSIAATPERWWGLVRFEPGRSVEITVEEDAAYRAWLVILPPGDAGQSCDCDAVTMIAGEATEGAHASAVLRPGPVRVHGEPHRLRGRGADYSISLHARAHRPAIKKRCRAQEVIG